MRLSSSVSVISLMALGLGYACSDHDPYVLEGSSYEEIADKEARDGRIEINYEGLKENSDTLLGTDDEGKQVFQPVTRMSIFIITENQLELSEEQLTIDNLKSIAANEDKPSLGLDAAEVALAEIMNRLHNTSIAQLTPLTQNNGSERSSASAPTGLFDVVESSYSFTSTTNDRGLRSHTIKMLGEGNALDAPNANVKRQQFDVEIVVASHLDRDFHIKVHEAAVTSHLVFIGGHGGVVGHVVGTESQTSRMKTLINEGRATPNTIILADGCGTEVFEKTTIEPAGDYAETGIEINTVSQSEESDYARFGDHISAFLVAASEGRDWTAPTGESTWGLLDTLSITENMSLSDIAAARRANRFLGRSNGYFESVLRNNKELKGEKSGYRQLSL